MFFRRRPSASLSFEARLETLRRAGFRTEPLPQGGVRLARGGSAAVIDTAPDGGTRIERAGRLAGDEIALLVDGGYQKFWQTPRGRRMPATADQLRELHDLEEDLKEAFGLESLYNTSLGTTNDLHLYDRVQGRESRSGSTGN